MKPVENGVLHLPSGFGTLVRKYISSGVRARYVLESDSVLGGHEVAVVFPTPRPFLWGVRFVVLTFIGPLGDGFVMVEVLPGRFSGGKAEREVRAWTVNALGRNEVLENEQLALEGKAAVFTKVRLEESVTWGSTCLTVPTLSFNLHTSAETEFVAVPLSVGEDQE